MSNSVFNGVKWTSISTIYNMIVKIVQISFLTRFLSKSDFGLVAIALLFVTFTSIFSDMGFSSAVLHKQDITKKEYSSLYWPNILIGVFLYVVLVLCSPLVAAYYDQPILKTIIPIISLNIVFLSIIRLQKTKFIKQLNFKIVALIDILSSTIMLVSAIIFTLLGWGVYAYVVSSVLCNLVIAVLFIIYTIFRDDDITFHLNLREITDYFKIGAYQVGSALLNFFTAELDVIIISSSFSLEVLGVYNICKQLAVKIYSTINPIITKVLTPTLALAQGDTQQLKQKYLKTVGMVSFVNSPIHYLLIIVAPILLRYLYGESYVENSMIFILFCINYSICAIGNPQGSLLVALGKTNYALYWTIYTISVTAVGLFLASHTSNIYILITTLIAINIISIVPEVKFIYGRLINVSLKDYVGSFAKSYFISVFLLILLPICTLPINQVVAYSIAAFLYVLLYLIISKRVNREDWLSMLNLLPFSIRSKVVKVFR